MGFIIVLLSLIIGYLGSGGNIGILMQFFEWLQIIGISCGIFIFANTKSTRVMLRKNFHKIRKKAPYTKSDTMALLLFISGFLKYAHLNGMVELEKHIDYPKQSTLFKNILTIPNSSDLIEFFCDYFRIVMLGFSKPHELEIIMDEHVQEKRDCIEDMADAVLKLGDALPAIGIIAAVLGVVTAMGAVGGEAAVLGAKIASALVGTFIGIFLSYGIVTPIGTYLQKFCLEEIVLFDVLKAALISHMNGNAPSVSIEFARQLLPEKIKPSFNELEKKLNS